MSAHYDTAREGERAGEQLGPQWIEAQRRAALMALAAAQTALRCGQVETARVKLLAAGEHLNAMAGAK